MFFKKGEKMKVKFGSKKIISKNVMSDLKEIVDACEQVAKQNPDEILIFPKDKIKDLLSLSDINKKEDGYLSKYNLWRFVFDCFDRDFDETQRYTIDTSNITIPTLIIRGIKNV